MFFLFFKKYFNFIDFTSIVFTTYSFKYLSKKLKL